jgi:hypothetical protein
MICFDTQILIWGVQGWARPSQVEMIDRCKRYIAHLDACHEVVMVPTPALFEYLIHFGDGEERRAQRTAIERHFFVPGFDLPATILAADLHTAARGVWTCCREEGITRQEYRVDVMIAAIAISQGAAAIITTDPHFRGLVGGRIPVMDVPDPDVIPPEPPREGGNLLPFDRPTADGE